MEVSVSCALNSTGGKRLVPLPSQKWQQDNPDWDKPASKEDYAEPSVIWVDDASWDEAQIPHRPWIAPGFLLRGAVTLLCGPPSAMKSSLVLSWACAVALMKDFGRLHPVGPPSPVLVYNVEDNAIEQRRRLSATLRQFGATPTDISGRVIRTGPKGLGTLLVRDDKGNIQFTPAMDGLKALIEERKPAVLVVDPLAELHVCEENDNNALRGVVAAFRQLAVKYNMAVLVLHHTRKGGATSPGDPDIARGASAIIGAARIVLTLTGMSEADAEAFGRPSDSKSRGSFTRLDDAKQNYHAIRDAEWFQKHPYTLDSEEVVPAAEPWTPPEAKVASQTDLIALAKAIEHGSPGGEAFSPKLSADPRSVRTLLVTHGFVGTDTQKACLQRLRNECGVEEAKFKRKNRSTANGLHVGFKPQLLWIGDGGAT
jgi:hypothetical protein